MRCRYMPVVASEQNRCLRNQRQMLCARHLEHPGVDIFERCDLKAVHVNEHVAQSNRHGTQLLKGLVAKEGRPGRRQSTKDCLGDGGRRRNYAEQWRLRRRRMTTCECTRYGRWAGHGRQAAHDVGLLEVTQEALSVALCHVFCRPLQGATVEVASEWRGLQTMRGEDAQQSSCAFVLMLVRDADGEELQLQQTQQAFPVAYESVRRDAGHFRTVQLQPKVPNSGVQPRNDWIRYFQIHLLFCQEDFKGRQWTRERHRGKRAKQMHAMAEECKMRGRRELRSSTTLCGKPAERLALPAEPHCAALHGTLRRVKRRAQMPQDAGLVYCTGIGEPRGGLAC
eukprot:5024297-Prymnesium_polylepis.2